MRTQKVNKTFTHDEQIKNIVNRPCVKVIITTRMKKEGMLHVNIIRTYS